MFGRVVDSDDMPLRDAVITRVYRNKKLKPFPRLYKRTTGRDGTFRFYYTGSGGKPVPVRQWMLQVTCRGYKTKTISVTVPWKNYRKGSKDFGYVKKGIRIVLEKNGK